jgi:hypothetical protein
MIARVSGTRAGFLVSIENAGHRLDERRLGEADMVGNGKHIALLHGQRRDTDELGKRAVLVDAERPVIGIEVALARDRKPGCDRIVVRRDTDTITRPEAGEARADAFNDAGHFVADDQWRDSVPVFEHPRSQTRQAAEKEIA